MIDKVRRNSPQWLRKRLKEMTGRHPILSFFIALSYGFLLKPYRNPWILGKGIPKLFVVPDICAVDCANEIFIKRVYERFYNIKRGGIVVDVGANVGMFSVKAAMEVGESGKVIAIEPEERNFRLLKKNVMLYCLKNVVMLRKALAARSGRAPFLISLLSGTHQLKHVGKIPETPEREVEVEVDTLDNVCKVQGIEGIDLLKIDVEGAELEVLKGADQSLKFTRNIAMELDYEGEELQVKEYLRKKGFKVKVIENMLYASKQ
jgi:FkbM family methyltransferase